MLKKDQLERLLTEAMDSGADFAEIFEEDAVSESLSMLDGKVENVDRALREGTGIRLYKDLQTAYGYSNSARYEDLLALVKDLRTAFEGTSGRQVVLTEEAVPNISPVKTDPVDAPLQDKTALMMQAWEAVKDEPEIEKVSVLLSSLRQKVQISNSDGRLVKDTRIRTRMGVSVYAARGEDRQSGFEGPGASMGLEFYEGGIPAQAAKNAAATARVLLDAVDAPSGRMPVIIDNGFGGVIFHEACGHALEATAVAKEQSVFAGKKGTQIASTKVTAIDDGTIPNAWGSQNVDDEGNPQQRRVLIQDGILTQYMVDRFNGRRMQEGSSGSGRRQNYKYEPTSRMSNTYIAAGSDEFDEMFEGIEKGLYAKRMGGGSVNPQTGEFNFAVSEGYLIENGKVTKPVRGASLIGSGAEILMNIDRVGKDLKRAQGMCGSVSGSIPTDVGQPAIRVSSITVGGTAGE